MKEALIGCGIGLIICLVGWLILSPYYSLWKLKDIANEIEKIRKILEKRG